ncbi:MAG TPA: FHA domain-containing protein [Gemmatales bacterium]|nr:FHA domain-containing protein [Gemmatales bacterium]
MQKSLVAIGGTNHGRVVPVIVAEFRIGRDAMCHLRPASTDISRLHCAIVTHPDGRVFLRDYGSNNGTAINHRFLIGGEYQLKDGDVIEVGPLVFRFHLQGAEVTTLSASVNSTMSIPQSRPASVPVPPPLPRPVLPGLTTISSVPRGTMFREESALETTPDLLTDSHIFSVHDADLMRDGDTLPQLPTLNALRQNDAGPRLVHD